MEEGKPMVTFDNLLFTPTTGQDSNRCSTPWSINVRIFGSVVRGEVSDRSDVDFLVDSDRFQQKNFVWSGEFGDDLFQDLKESK
jgi:predicted nucleotidyltransferase